MQEVKIHEIARHGRRGLQQIILGNRTRHVRQRVVVQESSRRGVDRWNLAAVTQRTARAGKVGKWIVKCDAETAKVSAALGFGRHRREVAYPGLLRLMLEINEEIGVVNSIVNVRDLEWPAQVAAKPLIVASNLRKLVAGNRIRLRVKCGIAVVIVETETNTGHGLAEQSNPATSARKYSASPAKSARRKASPRPTLPARPEPLDRSAACASRS